MLPQLSDLYLIQERKANNISHGFVRYLYHRINWESRLLAIVGARGTGKTTLILQHYIKEYQNPEKCLYISADNPLVIQNGIYRTVAEYFKYTGQCVMIDEVHKQSNWATDVKALYDAYPDKKIIVSGSSATQILNEKGDLSRRMLVYHLNLLSFREYLNFRYQENHSEYSFEDLLSDHFSISRNLLQRHPQILGDLEKYRETGNYPFSVEYSAEEYFSLLENIIDKIVYEDITKIKSLQAETIFKLRKLIGHIALSKIPQLHISNLTSDIGVSKDTLYLFFDLLNRSNILNIVRTVDSSPRVMKKSKILFRSTNLYYALSENWWKSNSDPGNIREAFFADQVGSVADVYTSMHVDFIVQTGQGSYEVEVGGKNKSKKQILDLDNAYVFKDGIEIGQHNVLPLYLAGFLY